MSPSKAEKQTTPKGRRVVEHTVSTSARDWVFLLRTTVKSPSTFLFRFGTFFALRSVAGEIES
jgi:hypothetical protein